jgi:branched-chain amino acid transport system permease protein
MIDYTFAIAAIVLIYAILALGLNLEFGHTGIINFGHVAFFAAGAYTSTLLTLNGAPIALGILAAVGVGALLAYPLGVLTLRLKEDYLAIVTIGFSESLRLVLLNSDWSGGPSGLSGIPTLFGELDRETRIAVWMSMMVVIVLLLMWMMHRLLEAPFGRVLRALRSDETAASSLGKDVGALRTTSLLIGSAVAGGAGALYAHWIGYISPDQFEPLVTFYVFTAIVLGGASQLGAVLGTVVLFSVLEASRFLKDFVDMPLSASEVAQLRFGLVGLVLIILLQRRPQGVLPYRHRTRMDARSNQRQSPTNTREGGAFHAKG